MANPVVRDLRARKLWTQAKLAHRARLSVNTINRIENEKGYVPNVVTQERIARALGVERQEIWPEPQEAAV